MKKTSVFYLKIKSNPFYIFVNFVSSCLCDYNPPIIMATISKPNPKQLSPQFSNFLFVLKSAQKFEILMIIQQEIQLKAKSRGFHIVTDEIESKLNGLSEIKKGIAHVFIKHTSASLSINENADPTVRTDFETFFNRTVPEDVSLYQHTYEGTDDMTSHIKSSILGSSVSIPVTNGRFNLGTWQGIYLCEHRNYGGARKIVVTVMGE